MVIEYIKRGQVFGYDGDKLVYKKPLVITEEVQSQEEPTEEDSLGDKEWDS